VNSFLTSELVTRYIVRKRSGRACTATLWHSLGMLAFLCFFEVPASPANVLTLSCTAPLHGDGGTAAAATNALTRRERTAAGVTPVQVAASAAGLGAASACEGS
jgi:hypothetical protein